MRERKNSLVLFSKPPAPGLVKTRLTTIKDGVFTPEAVSYTHLDRSLTRGRQRAYDRGMPFVEKQFSPKVVLVAMLVGTFVASVSQSMLTSALPAVMREFGVDATLGQLLTTSYMYTLGIVAAFSAFLITRCNVRRLFLGALALFAAGCVLAYYATTYPLLLAARLMQACGTGVLMPLIQVVALEIYPKDQYGQALGLVAVSYTHLDVYKRQLLYNQALLVEGMPIDDPVAFAQNVAKLM